jgi:hypothetical protein
MIEEAEHEAKPAKLAARTTSTPGLIGNSDSLWKADTAQEFHEARVGAETVED